MPKLSLSQQHGLSRETLRERIGAVEVKLRDKYKADTRWPDANTLEVSGPGVKGALVIHDDRVTIDLDLGFLLSPFKGKLEESLTRELQKVTRP